MFFLVPPRSRTFSDRTRIWKLLALLADDYTKRGEITLQVSISGLDKVLQTCGCNETR
jgi:hypothetical protein